MSFKAKILAYFAVFSLALSLLAPTASAAERELYVGTSCPHCAEVEEFLDANGGAEEFDIVILDVYADEDSRDQFTERLEEAGQNPQMSGVPTLFYEGEMVVGSTPIIEFLQSEYKGLSVTDVNASSATTSEDGEVEAASDEEGAGFGMWFVIIIVAATVLGIGGYVYKGSKGSNTSK